MWLQSRHDDYAGFITDWMIQSHYPNPYEETGITDWYPDCMNSYEFIFSNLVFPDLLGFDHSLYGLGPVLLRPWEFASFTDCSVANPQENLVGFEVSKTMPKC